MPNLLFILELTTCVALILSAAIFVKNGAVLARTLHSLNAHDRDAAASQRMKSLLKRVARLEGTTAQTHIQSKIAQKMSAMAHDKAVEAQTKVGALEKSTHRVQFMPLDKLLDRNREQSEIVDQLLNPSNENFDWFGEPDEEEMDD